MKRPALLACFLTVFGIGASSAQEQLGLRLDNRAGINGILFNPAATTTFPYAWDVNLIEGAQFFANNYAYFQQSGWLDFRDAANREFVLAKDLETPGDAPKNAYVLEFYDDNRKRYLFQLSSLLGPSFFVRLGEYHHIGLITRGRLIANARNVDTDFSYYTYYNRPFLDEFSGDPFKLNLFSAAEIGLNYALTLPTADGRLSLGITAKYLLPYEGGFIENQSTFQLNKLSKDSLQGSPFRFDYGYTNGNLKGDPFTPQINGSGYGLDLGFLYMIGGDTPDLYRWKFGVALTDLGVVRFSKNSRLHQAYTDGETQIDSKSYVNNFNSIDDLEITVRQFSLDALNNTDASLVGDAFSIGLPTTLNLQVDYNVNDLIFLNAAFVQGLPLSGHAGSVGNILAFTPRLEHRWFGAALPTSLYNGNDFRLGLAVRLAVFTLGTDDLGSLFGQQRLDSGDVYAAIKFSPLLFGQGKSQNDGGGGSKKGKSPRKKGGVNEPGCYRF